MKAYEGAPSSVKSSKPMSSVINEGVKAVSAILFGRLSDVGLPPIRRDASTHQKGCFHPLEAGLPLIGSKTSSAGLQSIIRRTSKYHPLEGKVSSAENGFLLE
jgi:hypothetical protein